VSAEEHERLEAIEKMVKLKIPRDIIPGYEPDSRSVSTILPPPERKERSPRAGDRGRGGRSSGAMARQAVVDPIFQEPYTPKPQPTSPDAPGSSAKPATAVRPQRQVAALLGGLIKKA
jgi:ATP-dependent RNA helicase RhlE